MTALTIHADLSATLLSADGTQHCRIPHYHPETLQPFASRQEVEAYALSIQGNPQYFQPINTAAIQKLTVSPIEFKLLFTAAERLAIKQARHTDPLIDDFFSIVEDSRLTHVNLGLSSTQEALTHLVTAGLITAVRKQQILSAQEV